MKTSLCRVLSTLVILATLFPCCPPAAAETHEVQPAGRIAGKWVAEPASVSAYLTSILLPVSAQCEWFGGNLIYKFTPGGTSPAGVSLNTMEIQLDAGIVQLTKGRSGPGPADRISFAMNLAYAAPYTIHAAGQLLEFGTPSPDASSASIENLMVNEVEVMRESGSVDMLGLDLPFAAAQMRFEFLGDDRLQLTPIFPPAPDGVSIVATPLTFRRQ